MTSDLDTILKMFSYCRPMGSKTEQKFVDRFLKPLGFKADRFGNMHLKIGDKPRILFSSHFDTVHRAEGRQSLQYEGGILTQTSGSSCLGADDTAGIWLMTEMVKAKIPGLYIIHFGEEVGGIGSRAIAYNTPEVLDGIQIAIAFDRQGYGDIVTHQRDERTASDAFAQSLAEQLGGSFAPSPLGIYTDTAEYSHLIPECTNISVGYFKAHSPKESQDVVFLMALREALLQADWSQLVVERDPAAQVERCGLFANHRDDRRSMSLEDLCFEYPEVAAEILAAFRITAEDFSIYLEENHGIAA